MCRAGAALAHLREVRDKYWDHDWRREHRGYGRYPENDLWEAAEPLQILPLGLSKQQGIQRQALAAVRAQAETQCARAPRT